VTYVGRFAPSPTGPLHAGSLVAAFASWLDARAHGGRWLLRIDDIDTARTVAGADGIIMGQLRMLGLHWDGLVMYQSRRGKAYQHALDTLIARGLVYGCACTRREIADSTLRPPGAAFLERERPYPGTCRNEPPMQRPPRAWRLRVPAGREVFEDRWLGLQQQDVAQAVGDFVLRRADHAWAYQLAVVVDDAAQGITDVVRGLDLLGSTARQRVLARLLALPAPRVMHVPLAVDAATGLKLSKQNHAPPLDLSRALVALQAAWQTLGFTPLPATHIDRFFSAAIAYWAARFEIKP